MPDAGMSRLDRLKASIGTENMPPKQPQHAQSGQNPISELPTVEQHLAASCIPPESTKHVQAAVMPSSSDAADTSFDPRCGEPAARGVSFIPFIAVTKFCYTYVRREYQQEVATALFDASKVWMRKWDLYFIWNDHCPTGGPMVFITDSQFETLINDINKAVPGAKVWSVEKLGDKHDGLVCDFDDVPVHYRPRYLGQSTSKDQYSHWINYLDSSYASNEGTTGGLEKYNEMLAAAHQVNRGKGKNKRGGGGGGQAQPRFTGGHGMGDLKRAQRILGLVAPDNGNIVANLNNLSLSKFDSNKAPAFPFDQDAIIIAFDCEAHERQAKAITEVGVATLDTRDLQDLAPGVNGTNWQEKIRARHFRVEEYRYHTNSEFVHGCPNKFDFGESEFVHTADLPSVLTSCFRPPYSGKTQETDSEATVTRNLILMGHDVTQDIYYVRSIGFDPMNRGNMSMVPLDSAELFRSFKEAPNKTSLGNALQEFDLFGWNLHNAGNDAVFTIWTFLATCVAQTAKQLGGDCAVSSKDEVTADRPMSSDGGVLLPKV